MLYAEEDISLVQVLIIKKLVKASLITINTYHVSIFNLLSIFDDLKQNYIFIAFYFHLS